MTGEVTQCIYIVLAQVVVTEYAFEVDIDPANIMDIESSFLGANVEGQCTW